MREVVYSLTASLDGYINRLDGSLDWISMDLGIPPEEFFRQTFSRYDAALIGRKTWQQMAAAPGNNAYPGMTNYVVSRTLPPGRRDGFEFVSPDLPAFINGLRSRPGKNIWLTGGGGLARSLLDLGLVDRIDLSLQPVLLGRGVGLFPSAFRETKLQLTDVNRLGPAIVRLSYSVVR